MKRLFLFALLGICASAVWGYDFSQQSNGKTLYYTITSAHTVKLVNPDWEEHTAPSGVVVVPATVVHGGTTYQVVEIDRRAFAVCQSLSSITLPEGLTTIGSLAFMGCSALASVSLPSTLTSIGSDAFNGCAFVQDASLWSDDTTTLYLGTYLIKVSARATGTLDLRAGTTGIAGMAVYACDSIDTIVLPQSLRFADQLAFANCASLRCLRTLVATPPTLALNAINDIDALAAIVPCGSAEAYRAAAVWSTMAIEEECDTTNANPGITPFPWPVDPLPIGPIIGIDSPTCADVQVAQRTGGIAVQGAVGRRVVVYTATANVLYNFVATANNVPLALPTSGIYLVCIEGAGAKKIAYLK